MVVKGEDLSICNGDGLEWAKIRGLYGKAFSS